MPVAPQSTNSLRCVRLACLGHSPMPMKLAGRRNAWNTLQSESADICFTGMALNPVTWIPMYGAGYLLGAKILGMEAIAFEDMTMTWLMSQVVPLWLGSIILGSLAALAGYQLTRAVWRLYTVQHGKCAETAEDVVTPEIKKS